MSRWRNWLMDQPEEDRIEAAIWVLEEITGDHSGRVMSVMQRYGLTRTQARLVLALAARPGRPMSRDALVAAVYDMDTDPGDTKIIDVFIHKIRAKGVKIRTLWGMGWVIDEPLDIPEDEMPERRSARAPSDHRKDGERWSGDDCQRLEEMVAGGWDIWAIADELGRTERSVREKIRGLGCRG